MTEKLGLLAFLVFVYPLTWKDFFGGWENPEIRQWVFPALGVLALLLPAIGLKNLTALTRQWRWTWFAALLGMMLFMATVWFGCWQLDHATGARYFYWGESWSYLAGTLALFVFCLLQIQVGLQERSPFLVNLGVVFIALDIIAAYCDLFGSMARTGLMFFDFRRVPDFVRCLSRKETPRADETNQIANHRSKTMKNPIINMSSFRPATMPVSLVLIAVCVGCFPVAAEPQAGIAPEQQQRLELMKSKGPDASLTILPVRLAGKPWDRVTEVVGVLLEQQGLRNIELGQTPFDTG